ncbi:hypothetical protein KY290_030989 [Solanum tuberosum]|uniref:Uncharacterized protein n=1 Tax=Solanum tuberosum TaxID=4113 RepID=A0ABQ7U9H2_SOLTU|nr:hypothetical protein KY290_030989 [Solanum tuberosum]
MDRILGDSEPVFDQTPEVVLHPSTDSSDTDEDNVPLRWAILKRMVIVTTNGKEKVIEETTKKRPFTRAISQELMGDAMNSSKTTTTENRRRRRSGDVVIELSANDVMDVSNELSENESMDEDIPLVIAKGGKGKQLKKSGKVKSRTPTAKKGDTTKGKEKESQKKREPSKRKRETSPVHKQNSEQGLGTKQRKDDKEVYKQTIIDNLRLQKVLGGRVFDTEILTKPGMNSLVDLMELQSWTHLFMTKFPVLHEEQVREFYYNVEFAEDDSFHTWVGNKSLYLDEELLGKIQEVPREETRSVVGKSCTKQFVKECSKLPDMHCAGVQKKIMKGEYQLLF